MTESPDGSGFDGWRRFDDRESDDAGPARSVEIAERCRCCWGGVEGPGQARGTH